MRAFTAAKIRVKNQFSEVWTSGVSDKIDSRSRGMLLLQLTFLCVAFGSVQAQGKDVGHAGLWRAVSNNILYPNNLFQAKKKREHISSRNKNEQKTEICSQP